MNILLILIPASLILGIGALFGFLWTLKHNQYEDLQGNALRIFDETDDEPDPSPDLDREAQQTAGTRPEGGVD